MVWCFTMALDLFSESLLQLCYVQLGLLSIDNSLLVVSSFNLLQFSLRACYFLLQKRILGFALIKLSLKSCHHQLQIQLRLCCFLCLLPPCWFFIIYAFLILLNTLTLLYQRCFQLLNPGLQCFGDRLDCILNSFLIVANYSKRISWLTLYWAEHSVIHPLLLKYLFLGFG